MSTQPTRGNSGLFSYLLLLTFFFILIEISLLIEGSEFYLGDFKTIADHLGVPANVVPGIVYFITIQLVVHIAFTAMVWAVTRLLGVALRCEWKTVEKIGLGLWLISIITVLIANQVFFPNSKFAVLTGFFFSHATASLLLCILLSVLSVALLFALRGLWMLVSRKTKFLLAAISMISVFFLMAPSLLKTVVTDGATEENPNIIFIGIDALRPDFLGFFGDKKQTPSIDAFLNQSTVFADALTPLARTFPAWVSILTGQYPKHNGVRFNLALLNQFNWQSTLPAILRTRGYQTFFATDEVRFSNIDQRFGFDTVVTPPIGFNDFLLGNLNDFPMGNLLVNTRFGKLLFPHSHANRPVSMTYDPNSFLNLLKPALSQPRTKPLFLAVHFCLPHFPYFWAEDEADEQSIKNYRAAVDRVDRQFQDFLILLKQNKLLDHSIVVLLSDHGEAFELAGDRVTEAALFVPKKDGDKVTVPRFYPPSQDSEEVNQSVGHGTDVLGLTQEHVVLAVRTYGLQKNKTVIVPGKVSLLDIKPTILDFLQDNNQLSLDGISLKPVITGNQAGVSNDRHFFMESDFSPQAVRSVHPETRDLLFQGINFFQIDHKTTRLNVKKEMVNLILSSKQYADVYQEWILALYPQSTTVMMPILVNLRNGLWTNDLNSAFAAKSPAHLMLKSMRQFYGDDIKQVLTETQ